MVVTSLGRASGARPTGPSDSLDSIRHTTANQPPENDGEFSSLSFGGVKELEELYLS
jgi:hypothetical protein